MGSESGGSAVDSVAGEHSGNVAGVLISLGRGWGQNGNPCLGPGVGFSRGKLWDLMEFI